VSTSDSDLTLVASAEVAGGVNKDRLAICADVPEGDWLEFSSQVDQSGRQDRGRLPDKDKQGSACTASSVITTSQTPQSPRTTGLMVSARIINTYPAQ
jgi:hypothetical protein